MCGRACESLSSLCNRIELPALFSVIRVVLKEHEIQKWKILETLLDSRIGNFCNFKILKFQNSQNSSSRWKYQDVGIISLLHTRRAFVFEEGHVKFSANSATLSSTHVDYNHEILKQRELIPKYLVG